MRKFPLLIVLFLITPAFAANVQVQQVPEGALHPQVVTDQQGVLHLIYVVGNERRQGNILYQRSQDGGANWSRPIQVNSQDRSAYADSVRGPHIAIGRNGRVHIVWMGNNDSQPQAPGAQRPLLYTRSNDRGNAFERQRNVIQRRPGLDGGGSIAADDQGNVYIAWHAPGDGEHTEQNRRIWLTHSSDDGRNFAAETQANPEDGTGICACCSLRLFTSGDGRLFLFYRMADQVMTRDSVLLVSDDRGESFRSLLRHEWRIGQCPMSSYSFRQVGDQILTAWESAGQIYFTRINLADMTYSAPTAAPGSGNSRKHPVMAVNSDGQMLLAWIDRRGWSRDGLLRWQIYDAQGNTLERSRDEQPVSNFTILTVLTRPDSGFTIMY